MRRESTFLYPAPPRKQPDETPGAPHRTSITSTVSHGGSQGSRRKCEQSTRTKRLHRRDPPGSWESARDLLSSGLAFCLHETDVCPAALIPPSPSSLTHNLQNHDPPRARPASAPANGLWRLLAFRAKMQTHHRAAVSEEEQ